MTVGGLTSAEAASRLRADGPNTLPAAQRRGFTGIALDVAREPMFLMRTGGAAIYLLLGDVREALVLAASVLVVMGITVTQERKTERALEALRDLSSPRAHVIRDGVPQRIASADVVRGDLLLLAEGDRVPADALLLEARDLHVDESVLTGEIDAAPKAVFHQKRQIATVIDMRMGKHHRAQLRGRKRRAIPIAQSKLFQALKQAAVNQNIRRPR